MPHRPAALGSLVGVLLVGALGASCGGPARVSLAPRVAAAARSTPDAGLSASAPAPASALADLRFDTSAVDRRVDPCTDFYDFACGGWRSAHPIPPDRTQMDRYAELAELNLAREHDIVEAAARAAATASPVEQRVGAYYAACMDEAAIDARGSTPLRALLARIDAIQGVADVTDVVAELHAHDVPALFELSSGTDLRDSNVMIAAIDRGMLGLGTRDEYLREDAASVALRERYRQHVIRVFDLLGGGASSGADADRVLAFETALARSMLGAVEERDAEARYHPMTLAALGRRYATFRWDRYAGARGLAGSQRVNVTVPGWLQAVDASLSSGDLAGLRAYLRLQTVRISSAMLSRPLELEFFDFYQRQRRGAREVAPRWKRCLRLVDRSLGDDVGRLFVARYFTAESRQRALRMTDALVDAFRASLRTTGWLGPAAREAAIAKLASVRILIGYPDRWRSYEGLRVERGDAFGNYWRARALASDRDLARLARPTDRDAFYALAQSVDGFGQKQLNNAGFTAGLLQPPVFDPRMDDAVNFGAIGAVIGHELTHQFDDEGRKYDAHGNLRDWWEPSDVAGFRSRARCFVDEYSSFHADDGTPINGALTLGENIADNGGLRLAWSAARLPEDGAAIDGFTPAQRFFLSWAQIRCQNVTPEVAHRRALSDEHAPGRWRVNGVVSNMSEFARAFSCGAGSPMVRPQVCRVW